MPGIVTQVFKTDQTGSVEQVGSRNQCEMGKGQGSPLSIHHAAQKYRGVVPTVRSTMSTKALRWLYALYEFPSFVGLAVGLKHGLPPIQPVQFLNWKNSMMVYRHTFATT